MSAVKLLTIIFVFFLVLCNKVVDPRVSRIIGGEPARAGQFPFSAAIYITTANGRYFCGGTLIGPQWILTAAQCVNESDQNTAISFIIHLGSNHLEQDDSNRVTVVTSEYVQHPDFNPMTLENDVGLIRLRQPVFYNEYIQRLLMAYDNTTDDTDLTGIGWGQISDSSEALSEELQFVKFAAISNDNCQAVYGNQISDHMICVAGEFNEGTCIGDSGSALLHDDPVSRAVRHGGISSFISSNGCESLDPSGYTRTYSFRNWIRNITAL